MSSPAVVDSVLAAIGHTPVVRLRRIVPASSADVFVKLEYFNATGSSKDRMALAMIEGAEARGALRPGMRVIEFIGGSTGSSLAMVCAIKGYEFTPLSSDAFARDKIQTMLVGVSRALKAGGSRARIIALEPTGSPVLTTGYGGAHRVEGTATGRVPPHLTKSDYDDARAIDEAEARATARRLAREEEVFSGLKYLAGDLFTNDQ